MKIFKNQLALVLFSTLFIGISMVSCSQSEEETQDDATAGSIIGRWALSTRSYTSNGVNSPEMAYENNQPGCALNDYFEFKDNAVFETGYYAPNCDITPSAGNWSRSGDMIAVTYPDDVDEDAVLELMSLSANEMKIRIDLTGTAGVEPGLVLFVNFTMVKVN